MVTLVLKINILLLKNFYLPIHNTVLSYSTSIVLFNKLQYKNISYNKN